MDAYGAADLARLQDSYPIPHTRQELERRHAALRDGEPFAGVTKKGVRVPSIRGSGDYYLVTPLPPFNISTGASFGTFTTLKDISPTPLPQTAVNQLRPGSGLLLEANGTYTCATGVTLQLGFGYGNAAGGAGGVNLALSSVITTGTSPTAWPWYLYYNGVVTSAGAAGSITGQGFLMFGTSLTAFTVSPIPITAAARTVAIDTTTSKLINVMAAYGTSGAGNTVQAYNVAALLLN